MNRFNKISALWMLCAATLVYANAQAASVQFSGAKEISAAHSIGIAPCQYLEMNGAASSGNCGGGGPGDPSDTENAAMTAFERTNVHVYNPTENVDVSPEATTHITPMPLASGPEILGAQIQALATGKVPLTPQSIVAWAMVIDPNLASDLATRLGLGSSGGGNPCDGSAAQSASTSSMIMLNGGSALKQIATNCTAQAAAVDGSDVLNGDATTLQLFSIPSALDLQ